MILYAKQISLLKSKLRERIVHLDELMQERELNETELKSSSQAFELATGLPIPKTRIAGNVAEIALAVEDLKTVLNEIKKLRWVG